MPMYHLTKANNRHRGKAPDILKPGSRWKSVVSFVLQPLYPQYPQDQRLGAPHSWSRYGDTQISDSVTDQILQPVTLLNKLSQLAEEPCTTQKLKWVKTKEKWCTPKEYTYFQMHSLRMCIPLWSWCSKSNGFSEHWYPIYLTLYNTKTVYKYNY